MPRSATDRRAMPSPTTSPVARQAFLTLFSAVMLPMFLAAVDQTLLATATPRIARELGSLTDSSWIVVGYLLAATVMAPVYGRLGDRYGRRPMLLSALGVFALGSIACSLAPSMGALAVARAVQGLGGGGLMVLSQALIGELVAPIDRPRYQGYFALVFTASSVGGPVLGGLIVHYADWRWLFWANLPLCALAAWRVSRLPKAPRSALRDAPTDVAGVLLFAITACATLLWLSLAGHRFAWVSPTSGMLLGIALAGGCVLAWQQRRHSHPFLPLDVLRLPGVPWICGMVIAFAGGMFALVFVLPIYLQMSQGASPADAGWQMLPLTGGLVLGSTLNARITARTALPARMPPYGLSLAAAALVVLALAPPSTLVTNVAVGLVGLGFGTVMPSAQLSIQTLAGRSRLGASAGLISLTRSLGASVGTAVFGALLFALLQPGSGAPVAPTRAPADTARAFHWAFGAIALWVAVGAWMSVHAPRVLLKGHEAHDAVEA